jgi:hypothetical protein
VQQAHGELAGLISVVQPRLSWSAQMVDEILKEGPPEALTGVAYAAVNVARRTAAPRLCRDSEGGNSRGGRSHLLRDHRRVPHRRRHSAHAGMAGIPYRPLHPSSRSIPRCNRPSSLIACKHFCRMGQSLLEPSHLPWSQLGRRNLVTFEPPQREPRRAVDISITLHRLGPTTRERGTDLFEDLLEVNAYTARETLDQIDNRFRGSAPAPRRRLPRRTSRAPRLRRAPSRAAS